MTGHRAHTVWLTALTIAVAGLALMLFLTRDQVGTADRNIRAFSAQAHGLAVEAATIAAQTRKLLVAGRHQKLITTAAICKQTNELTHKLKLLIISGVKGTRSFERVYRRFHFPPYRVRLRAAYREARSLDLVDCKAFTGG